MTDQEWKCLDLYVRDMADKLGLRDWTVEVKREPPDDVDAGAQCEPIDGRKYAKIYVAADFRELESERQRSYIIHELIHCHFAPACGCVLQDLWQARALSQQAYDVLAHSFKRQMEYGVDALATEIAGHYPVIEWNGRVVPDQ